MLLTQADLESTSFAKQTELCFVAFLAKQSLRRSLKQMHISYPSIQKRALGKFWLHCIMLNTVMIPSCHDGGILRKSTLMIPHQIVMDTLK